MRCRPVWTSSERRAGMRVVIVSALHSPHKLRAMFVSARYTCAVIWNEIQWNLFKIEPELKENEL
jgi:hypothetical protein